MSKKTKMINPSNHTIGLTDRNRSRLGGPSLALNSNWNPFEILRELNGGDASADPNKALRDAVADRLTPISLMYQMQKQQMLGWVWEQLSKEHFYDVAIQSEEKHINKRLGISYVYLLLIRDYIGPYSRSTVRDSLELVKGAGLQMRTASGGMQCAHQVLGELALDGIRLYLLPILDINVRRCLMYCSAAVTKARSEVNKLDNVIEKYGREKYKQLANIVLNTPEMSNFRIYEKLYRLFEDSINPSLIFNDSPVPADLRAGMKIILKEYSLKLKSEYRVRNRNIHVPTKKWVEEMVIKGFKEKLPVLDVGIEP